MAAPLTPTGVSVAAMTRLILASSGSVSQVEAATVGALRILLGAPALDIRVTFADSQLADNVSSAEVGVQNAKERGAVVLTAAIAGSAFAKFEFELPDGTGGTLKACASDLETISMAAGSALRSAILAAEVARAGEVSAVLCDTVRLGIAAPSLPVAELCMAITELAGRIVQSELFNLYVVDPPRREVLCVESTFPPFQRGALRLHLGQGVAGSVAATGRPLRLADVRRSSALHRPTEDWWGQTVCDMLCVPVFCSSAAAAAAPPPLCTDAAGSEQAITTTESSSGATGGRRVLAVLQVSAGLRAAPSSQG